VSRATLVYDDDCGFCTWSADWVAARSDVRTVGFGELTPELRDRLPDDYESCAHLVTEETVYSCGAAVEQAFLRTEAGRDARPVVAFLRQFADYERLRERGYRWVADRRALWGRVVSADRDSTRDGSS
jgi:predicted DCC family thiol-disulfide oxidoreductase YuxK